MNKENVNQAPIDYSTALMRTGGDEKFLSELIEIYISDFKIRFEALNNAVMDKNFDQLYHQGHTLIGSSANLSLSTLQEYSFQIEIAGKEKNLEMARSALKELNREFKRFLNYHFKEKKMRTPGVALK